MIVWKIRDISGIKGIRLIRDVRNFLGISGNRYITLKLLISLTSK
jgi:hypothetical protein